MKRITIIAVSLLSLGALSARAQNWTEEITEPVLRDNIYRNTLWFNSYNTAGRAFSPVAAYNSLDLRYDGQHGDFRPQQTGKAIDGVSLNTEGAVMLGKFLLTGDFSFRNIFEKGTRYNAIKYEIENDMPYYVADTVSSDWNRQEYVLGTGITSPVLWDRVAFGLGVNYRTKVGAKQADPRCEVYKYGVEVTPSVAVSLGNGHVVGLWALYENNFERSEPSINNYRFSKKVYITQGLGMSTNSKVGDNDGLKTCYWKGNIFGAGIQYGYDADFDLLADFGFTMNRNDAYTNISLPKRLGTADRMTATGNIQVLFGNDHSNRFVLDGMLRSTDGTEHIQQLNTEAFNQRWEVIASNKMSSFSDIRASLAYDHQFGAGDSRGYDWMVGGDIRFAMMDNTYSIVAASDDATNIKVDLSGKRNFKFKKATLLVGIEAGYGTALSGEYISGAVDPNSPLIKLYTADSAYRTANVVNGGGNLTWSLRHKRVTYVLDLACGYAAAMDMDMGRLTANAGFGILF